MDRRSPRPASLALVLAVLVALIGGCAGTATLAREVGVAEAIDLHDGGAFVLDVREPDEYAAGHIEGSTLIPLGQLASRTAEVPRDRTVLVVCRSGNRSAEGRDILLGAGFEDVTSLAGGVSDWAAAGQPLVPGP